MTILLRLLLVAGLLRAWAPLTAHATQTGPPGPTPTVLPAQTGPADPVVALQQAERARIRAMNRLATAPGVPPPPLPLDAGTTACPRGSVTRPVNVTSAATLVRALANARPGDQIRLADGVYQGEFVATASGTITTPITLCGTRAAVLEGRSLVAGYGLHLTGSYWTLAGFTVRNAQKGIMLDGASHNLLQGLEIYQIGEEGIHFRATSTDNRLEQSWIHHTGRHKAVFGEGVYIGSAYTNWNTYSQGQPDRSDRNQVLGNVIGPHTTAESIDVKEGTTGGLIQGNTFLGAGMTAATVWVNVKGNGYTVTGNAGLYLPASGFKQGIAVHVVVPGWGAANAIHDNEEQAAQNKGAGLPFRAAYGKNGPVSIVLPPRALPYSLTELLARFPASLAQVAPGVVLLKEHILVAHGARLAITDQDVHELRLLSTPARFVSIAADRGTLTITGADTARVTLTSWDPAANAPDRTMADGRAYVLTLRGRMDLDRVVAVDLGFGTDELSGVAWRGTVNAPSQGTVTNSVFQRNAVGAFAWHVAGMQWTRNVVADNLGHGLVLYGATNCLLESNAFSHNDDTGILCARGCIGNTLRLNSAYANSKQGIVLQGITQATDTQPASPATNNQVVQNYVWENEVGIALKGSIGNVVSSNDIHNNRYGLRLQDGASDNEIASNLIQRNAQFAVHIYNQADRNHVVRNVISGGQSGVVVREAAATVVDGNVIGGITDQGIVLDSAALDTAIGTNRVDDRASRAADPAPGGVNAPAGARPLKLARLSNRAATRRLARVHDRALARADATSHPPAPSLLEGALSTVQNHPAVLLWVIIFFLPVVAGLWMRKNAAQPKLSPGPKAQARWRFWQRGRRTDQGS